MGTWLFEPGHTAAMFRARHMMVTYVRGHFKERERITVFDAENPAQSFADVAIDAAAIWTGQPQRDAPPRTPDSAPTGHAESAKKAAVPNESAVASRI